MTIAFKVIKFNVERTSCSDTFESKEPVEFRHKIRLDEKDNRVVDVALRSFKFEVLYNGAVEDFEIGGQQVNLRFEGNGHDSGQVVLKANLRPRKQVASADPAWQFQGQVEALVIAELEPLK
ncbi:hypothetical protein KBP30_40285 [Streptomyces sp. Go40/10]|uniref:hypothetical protein n=1 Tax=Streptomyces sp. Go40/10 TaxID=2825844 RepID=UPI001E2A3F84|nr:hypothetical protein [Streptomyces sp. Go40/10]UFR07009.1 hypothetical protein KBP30_40285 [Streptomyces sp. Go40/10]